MLSKLEQILTPKRMFYFNIIMASVDMLLVVVVHAIGLSPVLGQVFLACAVCFMVAGLANWWRLRIQEENSDKSKK